MVTRTIKLRVVVPRDHSEESVRARRAIWATHAFVNGAVRFYEQLLLEFRQEDVLVVAADGEEKVVPAREWRDRLERRLSALGVVTTARPEALSLLRELYGRIVGEATEGSANAARLYHSALVDPSSLAGKSRAARLELLAPLLEIAGEARFAAEAERLLADNPGVVKGTGNRPTWLRQFQAGDPAWPGTLRRWLERQARGSSDDLLPRLRELGALPIAEPFSRGRVACRSALNRFERMAFALAVGHLMSWESWSRKVCEERTKAEAEVREWEARNLPRLAAALERVREWERAEADRLEHEGFPPERPVRIGMRQLRGWERLREWLQANPTAGRDVRRAFVRELQASMGREFGDSRLLEWLAAPEQADLLLGDGVPVLEIARYNAGLARLERRRRLAAYTPPDPREHPRWAAFDPPNNSNQPPFELQPAGPSQRGARLRVKLLAPPEGAGGPLGEDWFEFEIAGTAQLPELRMHRPRRNSKTIEVTFRDQDGLGRTTATLRGSTLMLAREFLETHAPPELARGHIGPVYLAAVLQHPPQCSEEVARRRQDAARWLKSAPAKRRSNPERLPPEGFRILSVDLGIRAAAAVSVWQVAPSEKCEGIPLPAAEGLSFRHERTAVLRLPGDRPSREVRARRREEWQALRAVRAALWALNRVRRLADEERPEARVALLDELTGRPFAEWGFGWLAGELEALRPLAATTGGKWREMLLPAYRRLEREVGERVSAWRRETRRVRRRPVGGKSLEWIEHLEQVRRLLVRWHLHQRPGTGGVRRLDRQRMGTVARHLLGHIQKLKEDRAKTTADLIVQAARGLVWRDGRWQRRHEPVDVIVLESLSRYLFRSDRPPAENRRLARWMHRRVAALVTEQASWYGIAVMEDEAAFTSRFHCRTGAPGIRCLPVTSELASELARGFPQWIARRLRQAGIEVDAVRPGDLLPIEEGPVLAAVTADGLVTVDADVNAAQNLGRWVLEAYGTPVQLRARRSDRSGEVFRADRLGERLRQALGCEAVRLARDHGDWYRAEPVRSWSGPPAAPGADLSKTELGLDPGAEEELQEIAEATGEVVRFFRDPSGEIESGLWAPGNVFWPAVKERVVRALREAGRLHG